MSAVLLAVIGAVWALPQSALAAPDRPTGLTAECSHEDSLEQLQEAKRERTNSQARRARHNAITVPV